MKTRIRRLYDIANILQVECKQLNVNFKPWKLILNFIFQSLQLIRKVHVNDQMQGCRKPAFEYTGPSVEIIGKVFTITFS